MSHPKFSKTNHSQRFPKFNIGGQIFEVDLVGLKFLKDHPDSRLYKDLYGPLDSPDDSGSSDNFNKLWMAHMIRGILPNTFVYVYLEN